VYVRLTVRTFFKDAFIKVLFRYLNHVDDSVQIPTRCSLAIEFTIPEFSEGSTYFERHTAHHQEL
jgi:hypothetical protein